MIYPQNTANFAHVNEQRIADKAIPDILGSFFKSATDDHGLRGE